MRKAARTISPRHVRAAGLTEPHKRGDDGISSASQGSPPQTAGIGHKE